MELIEHIKEQIKIHNERAMQEGRKNGFIRGFHRGKADGYKDILDRLINQPRQVDAHTPQGVGVQAEDGELEPIKCSNCKGRGLFNDGDGKTICHPCKGTGKLPKPSAPKPVKGDAD